MSTDIYCTGTFIGQRVLDSSINNNQTEDDQLKFTLCFTPTKEYPSLFGGALYQNDVNIIHGTYNGTKREGSMTEVINGKSTYSYQYKLLKDKSNGTIYLHGTWKSLVNLNLFGKLVMIHEEDLPSNMISGIWVGQSDPDEELRDFLLPINPIRWCMTLFRIDDQTWRLFGSGYFDDSADIPNQPLLFFTLDGNGTLDDMKILKKYVKSDYFVEYRGKFSEFENENLQFQGHWTNPLAGSYGSFFSHQYRLNSAITYKLDICICEVCQNVIYPGDTRWCCCQCHFSTCFGCHLNSIASNHQHQLHIDILACQKVVCGNTSKEFIENALKSFHSSPLLIYKNQQTNQFITMSYGEMAIKCSHLSKYWKGFLGNPDDNNRPMILLMCSTSPAYICCLLTGLLSQAVIVPINGSLHIDAIKNTLSKIKPSIIVMDEEYFSKVYSLLSSDQQKSVMIIYKNEDQFQSGTTTTTTNEDFNIISLSKALELGEKSSINIQSSIHLSSKTISAIFSTSGSTGYPKGAIFTEELLIPNDNFTLISPFIRIDYQPFDSVLVLSLMSTIRYGSSRGLTNLNNMWTDIKLIKPTSLGLTPSLWNIIYKNYLSKLNNKLTEIEKEQIAKQMREDLGGRVHIGTSGGGAISPTVLSFIRNKLKIDLVDMYGCRECGNISKNGVIYPGVSVKLLPVKDMSEFDGIHQGEICIHTPKIIQGYWGIDNHPSFIEIEGKTYYRTGDLGQLEGNSIKLLDRSGTMIKNSMGEWISPVHIENILEQLSEISTSFILGHANYSYLIAIVCPSQSGSTLNEIDMLQLIRFFCVHCGLTGPEIPQAVFIERNLIWNEQNGLMKEKKCRHALSQHYSHLKTEIFNQESIDQAANNEQLTEEFVQILERILNRSLKGQINGDNTFIEIGADSLAISLLCKNYNDRGIPLTSTMIYNHQLNHLNKILTTKHLLSDHIVHDINWNQQCRLPHHLRTLITNFKISSKKNILVTGAVGFLGPLLIPEIVQQMDKNVKIYCIIRATDDQHAKQRLQDDLNKCQRMNSIDWNRISCIAGDITKEHLGLTIDLYQKLTEEIGFIYHNASYVHLEMPYKALKQSNVQGTLNILEFALKSHGKLIYTSSVAALPRSNNLKEDSDGWAHLTSYEINEKDGYGQTKVVVERLLKQASDLGANITILRPCSISADTKTGFTNLNDFINILLRVQIELKTIVENTNMKLHFVPVDYCARVLVALSMCPNSQGKCFNLYGNSLNLARIYQILFDKLSNIEINRIKQNQWKEFVINNLSENNRYRALRDRIASIQFVQNEDQDERIGVPIDRTKEFLQEQCHLPWFQISDQDFMKSIDYMIEQKFLSSS